MASRLPILPIPHPQKQDRLAEKNKAMAATKQALDWIEGKKREPGAWERTCLGRALDEIISSAYLPALEDAKLAVTPFNERGSFEADPLFQASDLASLRRSYRAATGAPLPEQTI